MAERIAEFEVAIQADTKQMERSLAAASRLGRNFASTLTGAFADVAIRGRKLEDVTRSLVLSLSKLALKAAFKPLESAIGSAFGQAFSGLSLFGRGGVPGRQLPVPFAAGGVVAAPTAFSFGRGQLGVAGERGAEAILPLARGPDGQLGVRSPAGGGGGVAITFNVTAGDVESFQRSESQIAAMLNRVVGRGQRNI